MPKCKCGRPLAGYISNQDEPSKFGTRGWYCRGCKLPAKECNCEKWIYRDLSKTGKIMYD